MTLPIQTYVTSQDLQYYTQCLGCSIGQLGYTVANDFFYGKKCANSNLRKLELAIQYMNIIENYQPQGVEVQASGNITVLTLGNKPLVLTFYEGNLSPVVITTPSTGNILTTITNLTNQISPTSIIQVGTIIVLGPSGATTPVTIQFIALPGQGTNGNNLQIGLTNGSTGTIPFNIGNNGLIALQGGRNPLNDESNTITEEELQFNVLPAISQLLGVSLPQPGSITTNTTISGTPILLETGDTLTTEDSNILLTEL